VREWCSCGAAIRARRADVIAWRREHRCPDRPEPDSGAHVSAGAFVQHAGDRDFDGEHPIVQARIGFTPNI
jgi:hypothetical protein